MDGSVLPAAPLASIAAGQGGTVPLLIGSNRDEARLFLVAAGTIDLIDDPTLAAVAGAYGLPRTVSPSTGATGRVPARATSRPR